MNFRFEPTRSAFFLTFSSLEAVIGTTSNMIVMVTILRSPRRRQLPCNLLVLSLVMADFISSALFLPFNILVVNQRRWILRNRGIYRSLHAFCTLTSAFSIIAITIERCLCIAFSLRYIAIVTIKKAKMGIFVVWALSCAIASGYLLAGEYDLAYYYQTFLKVFTISSILFMLALNVNLFRVSWNQSRKIIAQFRSITVGREAIKLQLSTSKTARMLLLLVSLYSVTFIPIIVCRVIFGVHLEEREVYYWVVLISLSNSCINPAVYSLGYKGFGRLQKTRVQ